MFEDAVARDEMRPGLYRLRVIEVAKKDFRKSFVRNFWL